jgi:hypothetical protein
MASFASALTGGLQGAQQGALGAANADVSAIGASGAPGVAAPSPEANANVTNYVGGTLPAATAAQQAQSEYETALANGDMQAARFWDQQRSMEFERIKQEGLFDRDLRDIEAQRPKLYREAQQAVEDERRQELATLMSVLGAQAGLAETQSQIDKRISDAVLGKGKLKATQEANRIREEQNKRTALLTKQRNQAWAADAKERARISAMNAATARGKALGIDPDTGMPLPGFKFDAKGKVIKDPQQAKKADQSQKMEQTFRDSVFQWFKDTYVNPKTGLPSKRPPTKAELVRQAMNLFGNSIVGKGVSAAGVRMWATQVLNTFAKDWWSDGYWKRRNKPVTGTTTTGSTTTGVAIPPP